MMEEALSKEALFYEKITDGAVKCVLCPHHCRIAPDGTGICGARTNLGGTLFTMNYARVASLALDPIEKKPLCHFHPGSAVLSAGTFGCNLKCSFCQNWSISQKNADTALLLPGQLVEKAEAAKKYGNIGIAYTYNEPSIWYEYVLEAAQLAKEKQLCNILVTNGFIETEPLKQLLPLVDAMNIDVKAFTDGFYRKVCKGRLEAVKAAVELSSQFCHVEVTTLVIPGLNDSTEEIGRLCEWLSGISKEIPLHLSRFFPNYQMQDRPPTPADTLKSLRAEALKHLNHVYLGNVG